MVSGGKFLRACPHGRFYAPMEQKTAEDQKATIAALSAAAERQGKTTGLFIQKNLRPVRLEVPCCSGIPSFHSRIYGRSDSGGVSSVRA